MSSLDQFKPYEYMIKPYKYMIKPYKYPFYRLFCLYNSSSPSQPPPQPDLYDPSSQSPPDLYNPPPSQPSYPQQFQCKRSPIRQALHTAGGIGEDIGKIGLGIGLGLYGLAKIIKNAKK